MTTPNVEMIRRLFQAVEAREIAPMYEIYSPDVVIREAPSLPFGGEHASHTGILSHARGSSKRGITSKTPMTAEWMLSSLTRETGFACWRQRAHGRDGSKIDLPVVSVYEVHEGRVLRATMHHLDTAALLDFLDRQQ